MSCIAGVGGDVKSLVRKARSDEPIIAIDGCPLACTERVLAAKGVAPAALIRLHDRGLKKQRHADFDDAQCQAVFRDLLAELAPRLLDERPNLAPVIDAALADPAPISA